MASYTGQQCNINSQIVLWEPKQNCLNVMNVMDFKLGETAPLKAEKGMSVVESLKC